MDYSRPELADRLAAEYVLGTLGGGARRRFEALLPGHPALQRAVRQWQQRLAPLTDSVPEVPPRPLVWQRVQSRLFGESPTANVSTAPAARPRWWQRLALWQGATGLATAALVAVVLTATPGDTPPPLVIVLATNPGAGPGAVPASFVASVGGDRRTLVLRPIELPALDAARVLELWSVPAQGAPRSLGLADRQGRIVLRADDVLRNAAALAVSLEPAGGSPTGAPTGPILSLGKLDS